MMIRERGSHAVWLDVASRLQVAGAVAHAAADAAYVSDMMERYTAPTMLLGVEVNE